MTITYEDCIINIDNPFLMILIASKLARSGSATMIALHQIAAGHLDNKLLDELIELSELYSM